MKVFLDTNVWLRFLLADEKEQYEQCVELFQLIEAGKARPYTSTIVLLEVHYVLSSVYQVPKDKAVQDLGAILQTRNLTLIEKTNLKKAFSFYQKLKVRLADCLVAAQAPKDVFFCSFDQDFKRFPELRLAPPVEVMELLGQL